MVQFYKLEGPRRSEPLPRTYDAGRVCEVGGCDTNLSRYNSDNRCAMHQLQVEPRVKRRRRRPQWMDIEERLANKAD